MSRFLSFFTKFGLPTLAVGMLFAGLSLFAQTAMVQDVVLTYSASVSPTSVAQGQSATLSLSAGRLTADTAGAGCVDATFNDYWNAVATNATGQITTGPFAGQAIALSISAGTPGTGCENSGSFSTFTGSATLNTTGVAAGTYTFNVQVTDNFGKTVSKPVTLTITAVTNGQCGSAAKTYTATDNAFSGTLCSAGTVSPSSPAFPAQGGSSSWTCLGTGGGTNKSCTATRQSAGTPPTVSISANPSAGIANGGSTTLTWVVAGDATLCTASGSWSSAKEHTNGSHSEVRGFLTNPPTSYTYEITCSNAAGSDTDSVTVFLHGGSGTTPISGSCSASPANPNTGDSVTWTTAVLGGTGSYTYSWSGTDGLSGTSQSVSKTYSSSGNKTASVQVTSGSDVATFNCDVDVENDVGSPLACTPAPQTVGVNDTVYMTAQGGTGTYSWSAPGSSNVSGSAGTFSTSYSTTGSKTITLTSGTGSVSCPVTVSTAVTGLSCTPSSQTIDRNTSASVSATGGTGTYNWSVSPTTGVSNPTGTGSSFSSAFSQAGAYTVTLSDGSTSKQCSVGVANPVLVCDPANSTGLTGQDIIFRAYNGQGTYSWQAFNGGTPATGGNQTTFTVRWPAGTDTGTVRVGSAGQTAECVVDLSDAPAGVGTVVVNAEDDNGSALAARWTLNGPSGSQTTLNAQTSKTYTSQTAGTYTVSPISLEGYTASVSTGSQTLSNGGTITFTIVYTPSDETEPGDDGTPALDLKGRRLGDTGAFSDGPFTIATGELVELQWTTASLSVCQTTGNWNLRNPNPSGDTGNTGPLVQVNTYTFGLTCETTEGATLSDEVEVEVVPQCRDNRDNDSDGYTDYSGGDPGCTDADDINESDTVPQCRDGYDNSDPEDTLADEKDPGCHSDGNPDNDDSYVPDDPSELDAELAVCSDGFDNDGDGLVDYPQDPGCVSREDSSEQDDPDIREI